MKLAASLLGLGIFLCSVLAAPAQDSPAPPPATAQDAPPSAQEVLLATFLRETFAIYDAVLEMTPPSLQDPVYAGHVSKALDVSQLENMKDQLTTPILAGFCSRIGALQATYLLRGIKKDKFDPFAIQDRLRWDVDAATLKVKSGNYLRFQDELAQVLRFGLVCRTLQLEKLETHFHEMPEPEQYVFRVGYQDFQQGLAELVTYHLSALRDPVRLPNRQAVLDLLVQYSDKLAGGMNRETRKAVAISVTKALAAPGTSPDDVKKLSKIRQALNRKDCGKVCAFH